MREFINLTESQIEALYYALSYVFSDDGFEFVDEDKHMNKPLEEVFNKIINAYEDMHAPIDSEEEEYLKERLLK